MVNQHSADFVVVSLLLFWVDFASGFVKFRHQGKRTLINVVGDFLFQQGLVQVELFDSEVLVTGRWTLLKDPGDDIVWFGTFLNVGKDLVHFVRNYVSVLILTNCCFIFLLLFKRLVLFLLNKFILFNFNCFWMLIFPLSTVLYRAATLFAGSLIFVRLCVRIGNLLILKCSGWFFR